MLLTNLYKNVKDAAIEGIFKVPVLRQALNLRRAVITITHKGADGEVLNKEVKKNLIINVGRVQYHKQCFGTSGLATNGMNYIALSNDTLTETASSTTLSNEIAANGLTRTQGTVTLPTGSGNQTTIDKTFTATGSQSCQKAALFDASSAGNMNHVLAFSQRNLISGDTIQLTFSISVG